MIRYVYFILSILCLFVIRQVMVPIWGSWADLFFIVPLAFIWLWRENEVAVWLLIILSVLLDLTIIRVLPFYSLTTISSLLFYYILVLPYLSHSTFIARAWLFLVYIFFWRIFYMIWLLVGWLCGGVAINFDQSILRSLFGWLVFGFLLMMILLSVQHLWRQWSKKIESRHYAKNQ